jgi:RNA recognition motif-containing protein
MNIYVGNFPHSTTEDALTTLFADFGDVNSTKIILDKYSGQSRGFGFVEMAAKSEGLKAITALDGKELDGRTIKVNEARPRKNQNDFGNRRNRW